MQTADEARSAPPTIRLRRVPRCDPPFDDERERDAWASPDQLALPWPRRAQQARGSASHVRSPTCAPSGGPARSAAHGAGDPRSGTGTPDLTDPLDPAALRAASASRPAGAVALVPGGGPALGSAGDARLAVRRFVNVCVEVLNGYRPAAHLRRLAQPREAATVVAHGVTAAHRVAEARRQAATPTWRRRPAPVAIIKVSLCEPRPGAVEAAAVLMIGDRTWAMAIRLELHDDAWLATVMRLL
jgi:Family of unknown function (DUF6459)